VILGLSNESTLALIALGAALLKFAEKVYDDWRLRKAADKVKSAVIDTAISVKQDLAVSDEKKQAHLSAQDVKLEKIEKDVVTVKTQTNGALEKVIDAAIERGKAEARAEKKD